MINLVTEWLHKGLLKVGEEGTYKQDLVNNSRHAVWHTFKDPKCFDSSDSPLYMNAN